MRRFIAMFVVLVGAAALGDTYLTPPSGIRASCSTCDLVDNSLALGGLTGASTGQAKTKSLLVTDGSTTLFQVTAAGVLNAGPSAAMFGASAFGDLRLANAAGGHSPVFIMDANNKTSTLIVGSPQIIWQCRDNGAGDLDGQACFIESSSAPGGGNGDKRLRISDINGAFVSYRRAADSTLKVDFGSLEGAGQYNFAGASATNDLLLLRTDNSSGDYLSLKSYDGLTTYGRWLSTGAIQGLSLDALSGVALAVGGVNATTLNLGRSGQTQALLGNGTVAGTLVVTGAVTTSSTKNAGTIALSAGTGTATVTAGRPCVCTDTTLPTNLTGCSVSSTTLTMTAIGASDNVSYVCL